MNILITGATGFVGRHLCKDLLEAGHTIHCPLRLTAEPFEFSHHQQCIIYPIADLLQIDCWKALLSDIDVVIHCAAQVHVMSSGPVDYQPLNVDLPKRIAQAAITAGVKHFIYLSSIKVNGETTTAPFTALDEVKPNDDCAKSKWLAEQQLTQLTATSSTHLSIVRIPLVYGPTVKANFLSLMKAVSDQKHLPLGGTHNKRNLLFVKNLSDFLTKLVSKQPKQSAVYLVADSEAVSTTQLIQEIAKGLNQKTNLWRVPVWVLRVLFILIGKSGINQRLLDSLEIDSSMACHTIDWQPPYSFHQGIKQTCEWFQSRVLLNEPVSNK